MAVVKKADEAVTLMEPVVPSGVIVKPVSSLYFASTGLTYGPSPKSTVAMLKGNRGPAWLEELGLSHVYVTREGELGGSLLRPPESHSTNAANETNAAHTASGARL